MAHVSLPLTDPPAAVASSLTAPTIADHTGAIDLEAVLMAADLGDAALRLLVITLDPAMTVEPRRECVIYVAPQGFAQTSHGALQERAPTLPMTDRAFDVVLALRLVRPGLDATALLREALRVLQDDGSFVLVTDPRDFALLPPQGPALLAHRALAAAGISSARFTQHGAASVAIAHRRDARPAT